MSKTNARIDRRRFLTLAGSSLAAVAGLGLVGCRGSASASAATDASSVSITNVSYDPTRELYAAYNELFAKH